MNFLRLANLHQLGYDFRADGKAEHAIEERMRKAALRFSRMCHTWRSKELGLMSERDGS